MTEKTIYQIIKELNKKTISLLNFKEYYTPVELATELNHLIKTGIAEVDWKKKEIILLDFSEENLISKRNEKDTERKIIENYKIKQIKPNKPKLF